MWLILGLIAGRFQQLMKCCSLISHKVNQLVETRFSRRDARDEESILLIEAEIEMESGQHKRTALGRMSGA